MRGLGNALLIGGMLIASFISPMNSEDHHVIKGQYEDLGDIGDAIVDVIDSYNETRKKKEENEEIGDDSPENINKSTSGEPPENIDSDDLHKKIEEYVDSEIERIRNEEENDSYEDDDSDENDDSVDNDNSVNNGDSEDNNTSTDEVDSKNNSPTNDKGDIQNDGTELRNGTGCETEGNDEKHGNPDMEDDLVSAYGDNKNIEYDQKDAEAEGRDEALNGITSSQEPPSPPPKENDYDDRWDNLAEQYDPNVSGQDADKHKPGAVKQNSQGEDNLLGAENSPGETDAYYYCMGM